MSESEFGSKRPDTVVRVNQVGYLPAAEKRAIVAVADIEASADSDGTEADSSEPDPESFAVHAADDGSVAFEGRLSERITDPDAGEVVRQADFSGLSTPGEYVVEVDGERSPAFRIGPDVYEDTLVDAARLYTLKRSNTRIDDPMTGLDVEPGHTQDAAASLFFDDEFHESGEELDVVGGWYDAGDYGKYVPPAAVTVGQMLLAYERHPETFEAGQCDLPPGVSEADRAAGLPDLLVEAKFELEWLARMQRPDGAVYHKVAGEDWPSIDTLPVEDTRERFVFGLSTYGTAMYAAAMAMAARVYADFDAAFAERALANARDAQSYLESNPEPSFRFDEGQDGGSGPYRKDGDAGERFWAAAELLKTTGEERYADYLEAQVPEVFDRPVSPPVWSDASALGQWAYRSAGAADPDRAAAIDDAFLAYADDLSEAVAADGHRVALETEDYHWASSKLAVAKADLLLLANEIDPDERYVEAALDQVHYVLGRTPTGYSYVTGQGTYPPVNPHDRLVVSTGVGIPGMIVSGANRNGDDATLAAFIEAESPPPAKAYVDATASYSANEWAIDYTAPLFLALAAASER